MISAPHETAHRVTIKATRSKHACPRPDKCDHCDISIGAHAPVYYDRVRPLIEERHMADGRPYFHEKVGAFCTPFCLHRHRERFVARVPRTPYP
jgi:hypothetical protein